MDCLSFVYMPATSAAHNRLLFFFFLLRPFTVLMKKTRVIKQSIFLRCLWLCSTENRVTRFGDFFTNCFQMHIGTFWKDEVAQRNCNILATFCFSKFTTFSTKLTVWTLCFVVVILSFQKWFDVDIFGIQNWA